MNPFKNFSLFSELIGLVIDMKSGESFLPVLCGFCITSVRQMLAFPLNEWLRKTEIATHLPEWIMLPHENPHRKGCVKTVEMH